MIFTKDISLKFGDAKEKLVCRYNQFFEKWKFLENAPYFELIPSKKVGGYSHDHGGCSIHFILGEPRIQGL